MTPTESPAPPPATWAALADAVRAAQPGMYVVNMELLRNLEGGKRTDKAMPAIMEALKDRAVGHLPDPLPTRADALVALYMRGTDIGDLAAAIIAASRGEQLTPGTARALTEFGASAADDAALERLQSMMRDLEERTRRVTEFAAEIQPPPPGRRRR